MTLKISKQMKPTKPKAKSPGWHRLTLDELIHWAHAWKVQQTNPDKLFREKESATALHFGCDRSTINRRNVTLIETGVAQRLHEKERGENQRFIESTLCITTAAPASVLRLADAAQEVRQALKSDSLCAKVNLMATDSINPRYKPVSSVGSHLGVIEHSSGVGANMHTTQTRINIDDEPCARLHADPETLKIERQLKDAEKKLARLLRDYGEGEGIVAATRQQVDELRSRLQSKVTP